MLHLATKHVPSAALSTPATWCSLVNRQSLCRVFRCGSRQRRHVARAGCVVADKCAQCQTLGKQREHLSRVMALGNSTAHGELRWLCRAEALGKARGPTTIAWTRGCFLCVRVYQISIWGTRQRLVPLYCAEPPLLDLGNMFAESPTQGTRQISLCLRGVRRVLFAESYTRQSLCRVLTGLCRVFWALSNYSDSSSDYSLGFTIHCIPNFVINKNFKAWPNL